MPITNRIAAYHDVMTAWRRELHQHPEGNVTGTGNIAPGLL